MDRKNSGQSILEFLLMLPIMVAIAFLLFKVNMAMQMSIVNQQYARAQTLVLAWNNPVYPELRFTRGDASFTEKKANQMLLGVSDNIAVTGYTPKAMEQLIVRPGKDIGSDMPQAEDSKKRGKIRIRNNVAMCTPYIGVPPETGKYSFCGGYFK